MSRYSNEELESMRKSGNPAVRRIAAHEETSHGCAAEWMRFDPDREVRNLAAHSDFLLGKSVEWTRTDPDLRWYAERADAGPR